MKNALLIACALFYAFLPAFPDFQHAIFIPIVGILLGVTYFVFHRHEWGGPLLPWLLACIALGRVAAYSWMKLRRGLTVPYVDGEALVCGGLAALSFVFSFWKWLTNHTEIPNPTNGKST
jgi:hypothetical protein